MVSRRDLDLQRPLLSRLVIDLERGVAYPEALLEHPLERATELVAILSRVYDNVRG
jgi:hypothetical protein